MPLTIAHILINFPKEIELYSSQKPTLFLLVSTRLPRFTVSISKETFLSNLRGFFSGTVIYFVHTLKNSTLEFECHMLINLLLMTTGVIHIRIGTSFPLSLSHISLPLLSLSISLSLPLLSPLLIHFTQTRTHTLCKRETKSKQKSYFSSQTITVVVVSASLSLLSSQS